SSETCSALAQTALELESLDGAGDRDDVEVQALGRIAAGDERDLAEKPVAGVVVAFGPQHPQSLVVQAAAGRGLALIGSLNGSHVGHGIAGQADQRACPDNSLPHTRSPARFPTSRGR